MLNIHTALSALWTWTVDAGNVRLNGLGQFPGPKPERSAITPFSEKNQGRLSKRCQIEYNHRRRQHDGLESL